MIAGTRCRANRKAMSRGSKLTDRETGKWSEGRQGMQQTSGTAHQRHVAGRSVAIELPTGGSRLDGMRLGGEMREAG